MLIQLQIVHGSRNWPAFVRKEAVDIVESLSHGQDPLAHRARVFVGGNWLTTNHTVQEILDLIKES